MLASGTKQYTAVYLVQKTAYTWDGIVHSNMEKGRGGGGGEREREIKLSAEVSPASNLQPPTRRIPHLTPSLISLPMLLHTAAIYYLRVQGARCTTTTTTTTATTTTTTTTTPIATGPTDILTRVNRCSRASYLPIPELPKAMIRTYIRPIIHPLDPKCRRCSCPLPCDDTPCDITGAPGELCTAPSLANLGPSARSTGHTAWWTPRDAPPPRSAPRKAAWKPFPSWPREAITPGLGAGRGGSVPNIRSRAWPT